MALDREISCKDLNEKNDERLPENILKSKEVRKRHYWCRYENCGKDFTSAGHLYNHEKKVHGASSDSDLEDLICSKCQREFKTRSKLRRHMLIHESKRETFSCPRENCSKYYYHERNLATHIKVVHGGRRFICPHPGCGRSLANKPALDYHLTVHERKENKEDDEFTPGLACGICFTGFKIKANLEKHILEHQKLSEISQEKVINSEVLNGDTLNHKLTPSEHECQEPDSKHLLETPESPDKSLTCNICKRVFREVSKLRRHLLIHEDPLERKRFVCPHPKCKRSYTTNWNLSHHIKGAHEGDKGSYDNRGKFPLHVAALNKKKQMQERKKNLSSVMNVTPKVKLQHKKKNFRIEEDVRVSKSNKKRRKKLEKNSENKPPVIEKERIEQSAETDFTSVLEMESVKLRESFQYWLQQEEKSYKQTAIETIDIRNVGYKEEEIPHVKSEERSPGDNSGSDCEGFSVTCTENASYFEVMKDYTEKVSKLETEVIALTAREYYKRNTFNTDINKWLRVMVYIMEDMFPALTNAASEVSTDREVDDSS